MLRASEYNTNTKHQFYKRSVKIHNETNLNLTRLLAAGNNLLFRYKRKSCQFDGEFFCL